MKSVHCLICLFYLFGPFNCNNEAGKPMPEFITTSPIIKSNEFNRSEIEQYIINRIKEGIYDDYTADLCIDDLKRCNTEVFAPYLKDSAYSLKVSHRDWDKYPEAVKREIINEIIYYTWGHEKVAFAPLSVKLSDSNSLFAFLGDRSSQMYLTFSKPEYLKGGKGRYAYGPNCWYTAINAVTDKSGEYSRQHRITSSISDNPRFMGPTEFRCFMQKFKKVDKPQFGDIIRYYTDSAYYNESIDLYNGEVHAAVYIGKDTSNGIQEICLTKNGRNDLGFLLVQDMKGLDRLYLSSKENDPRKKAYFRIKEGASFNDPAICGSCSECYEAFKIDSINYQDRFKCLAEKAGDSCYNFPVKWISRDF